MKKVILLAIMSFSFMMSASAKDISKKQQKKIDKVRAQLVEMIPDAQTAELVPSPVDDVYRMEIKGRYAFVHVSGKHIMIGDLYDTCLLYTSPSPRDLSTSRMPSSA